MHENVKGDRIHRTLYTQAGHDAPQPDLFHRGDPAMLPFEEASCSGATGFLAPTLKQLQKRTEVIALTDKEATKENILLALKQLSRGNSGNVPTDAPSVLKRIKPSIFLDTKT